MPEAGHEGFSGTNAMKNYRIWGKRPYRVAVVHGGPGAPGYMAPVARELAKNTGVLEPLQTKDSINGQVKELADVLKNHADIPVVLIGHSWGAMLSCITTAHYPDLIKRLILIGTVPLGWKDLPDFTPTRLSRLSEAERVEFLSLAEFIWDGAAEDKSEPFGRFIRLITKSESYDLIPMKDEVLQYQLDINIAVGLEMRKFTGNDGLLKASRQITCPVTAICGDYDVRPAGDVKESLSRVYKDFKFFLLEKCGHFPWMERFARDKLYEILKKEIV
ncbi:MAG: alpha/beta hydrolase [Dehalococcoidales bacterium]|nr:alpha/beta hydrolase [Dehalococcoidales bacterium]